MQRYKRGERRQYFHLYRYDGSAPAANKRKHGLGLASSSLASLATCHLHHCRPFAAGTRQAPSQ
jgi:hypothetical protein